MSHGPTRIRSTSRRPTAAGNREVLGAVADVGCIESEVEAALCHRDPQQVRAASGAWGLGAPCIERACPRYRACIGGCGAPDMC